ncbi:uncharacterized protein LOC134830998 [Culicoides brevitarsis]|uniref:uncharacterized protein LOC134830998 n=1 Tax=Culicoides brevitarsis TaxID=469753 RepID=UPI00307C6F4F
MATAMNKLYASLNASELNSRIIFKGSSMSPQSDRDAGFCSGGSEIGDERLSDSPNSQIDVSDDSIEVKIPQIVLSKNKRKNSEPVKVVETEMGPLKKRIRFQQFSSMQETKPSYSSPVKENIKIIKEEKKEKPSVFRPWTVEGPAERKSTPPLIQIPEINPADVFVRHPGVTTLHRAPLTPPFVIDEQMEPLALVVERKSDVCQSSKKLPQAKSHVKKPKTTRSLNSSHDDDAEIKGKTPPQRNYKNMTLQRRIEANARERTRVHTISAAYEKLRKCIPSYSSSHKLSKLAVLRIAGAYIQALSRMNGEDLSPDGSQPDVNECIDRVRDILEREGKVKKEEDSD